MKRRLAKIALALALLAVAVEVAILCTPLPRSLTDGLPPSVEFLDRDGHPLRLLLADECRFSRQIATPDLAPAIIDATLSAEDKRFFSHHGIDPLATARAVWQRIRGASVASGASTITQQVIKLAVPGQRTIARKLREIWLALALEQTWSKERILTEYLNRLEYGNLCTGIAAASRFYFQKPPADLSPAEAAFLAGIPRAPSRLNPRTDPSAARARQQWVLARMAANRRIDAATFSRALDEPLHIAPSGRQFEAPHFVDLLLHRSGLTPAADGTVRTTLDLALTHFAEESIAKNVALLADKNAGSGAAVVIDNATGDVLALAGSGDYFQTGDGQIDGAWMVRSPGSAVKPFTYLLALEAGAEPATIVPDVPTEFATDTGIYRPNNYNHRFYGPVSLRFALGNSLNVGAIRALQIGGGTEALHRFLRKCGITTLGHPADYYGLGLTLGNGEVRLLELTNAVAALARLGTYRPYRLLARADIAPGTRISSRESAWQLADMLSDNAARLASFGSNSYLHFDFPVACKTGTSSDYRDNWTVAYTPEFSVGVWVGNPDNSKMRGTTGVSGAAPIMHEIMAHLHQRFGTSWFERPAVLGKYPIDPLTGHLVESTRPGALSEWFRTPPRADPSDYAASGKVRLSPAYREWITGPQNTLGALATIADTAPALRIIEPEPGSIYYIDSDLPAESQWIPLRAEGGGEIAWTADTASRLETARLYLGEGRHDLIASDSATGAKAQTWIEVRVW